MCNSVTSRVGGSVLYLGEVLFSERPSRREKNALSKQYPHKKIINGSMGPMEEEKHSYFEVITKLFVNQDLQSTSRNNLKL
tara:strand:- start:1260 stop:1502 length:243 start_codon:yes stop_codon:yes gene_type:complete